MLVFYVLSKGVFCPLKKHMSNALQPLIRTGSGRLRKVEWLTACVEEHRNAFTPQNIGGGFHGTGIYPFIPTKVLDRLQSSQSWQDQSRPFTRSISTPPFNDAVVTDSPIDMNAVRQANTALNELIQSGQPIPYLAKNYVPYFTRRYGRLQTRNRILERENENIKGVLGRGRKRVWVANGEWLTDATLWLAKKCLVESRLQRN